MGKATHPDGVAVKQFSEEVQALVQVVEGRL